ncbi:MAG TPA: dihydrolipoamide acetyltransferase family protein [Candidatus Binatia bacterium]|nr:dihydrolipoamide acetyltransferase family protein [Candidatus Binatia bacterium]
MAEVREFALPDLGEGLTEAEVVRWLVGVGDRVEVDQPVAEVSTEKAEVQVPTPFAGTVTALHAEPGERLRVGAALISVKVPAAAELSPAPIATTGPEAASRAAAHEARPSTGDEAAAEAAAASRAVQAAFAPGGELPAETSGNVLVGYGTAAGPRRRRRVVGWDGDASGAAAGEPEAGRDDGGSGAGGRAAPPGRPAPGLRRVALRGPRRISAERLSRSHAEIPSASSWLAADASGLLELRDLLNARQAAVHVTPLAVLLRLCVQALRRHPILNGSFDAETSEVVLSDAVHLGVATQTERGLLVPVIRDAQRLSATAIAAELDRLARLAREGRISAEELRGSTFTVSNFGWFGVDGGVAIINPPEAAILGVGRIRERPWVVGGVLAVRPVVELSLAFDHRVSDGAEAAGFLRLLGDLVEHPSLALEG